MMLFVWSRTPVIVSALVLLSLLLYLIGVSFYAAPYRLIFFKDFYTEKYSWFSEMLSRSVNGTIPVIYGISEPKVLYYTIETSVRGYRALYLTYKWFIIGRVMPLFYSMHIPIGVLFGSILLAIVLSYMSPSGGLQMVFVIGDRRYSLGIVLSVALVALLVSSILVYGVTVYAQWLTLKEVFVGFIALFLLLSIVFSIIGIVYVVSGFNSLAAASLGGILMVLLIAGSDTIVEGFPALKVLASSWDPNALRSVFLFALIALILLITLYYLGVVREKY